MLNHTEIARHEINGTTDLVLYQRDSDKRCTIVRLASGQFRKGSLYAPATAAGLGYVTKTWLTEAQARAYFADAIAPVTLD